MSRQLPSQSWSEVICVSRIPPGRGKEYARYSIAFPVAETECPLQSSKPALLDYQLSQREPWKIFESWMSALGHKRTFTLHQPMSALPPKVDICSALAHVRFGPIVDMTTNMFSITNTMVERSSVQLMVCLLVENPGNQRIDKIRPHDRRHVAAGGHFMHMPSGIRLGEQLYNLACRCARVCRADQVDGRSDRSPAIEWPSTYCCHTPFMHHRRQQREHILLPFPGHGRPGTGTGPVIDEPFADCAPVAGPCQLIVAASHTRNLVIPARGSVRFQVVEQNRFECDQNSDASGELGRSFERDRASKRVADRAPAPNRLPLQQAPPHPRP